VTNADTGGLIPPNEERVAVYVSAGSNVNPEANLRLAVQGLRERYGSLTVSSVYRNKAVGFEGEDFLNIVIGFETRETPGEITAALEELHKAAGRKRGAEAFCPRTLDLDLLLYGRHIIDDPKRHVGVPHKDLGRYGFVLGPLAEIAPTVRHPVSGQTMAELWQAFDQSRHPLQPVDIALS
jgi:2-amino-4-hydroxy-6-hydroxymethyldihydropteridine diphosphokinase